MLSISENSLNWSLSHAEKFGDTDMFPLPFEYSAIRYDWDTLKSWLSSQDLDLWQVRPNRRMLSPKAHYGFRIATQLDPLDFLLFNSVVSEIAPDIETSRVASNAQCVYSFRVDIKPDGQLFDPRVGYGNFQADSLALIIDNPLISHIVVTDISDFYSRIYLHRLENALTSSSTKRDHVRVIMKFLDGWNGSETYGIPVGGAATRILAEAALIDIDESLLAHGIKFKRYNDDIRIFATSYTEAYRSLTILADVLFRTLGLTLQMSKTSIILRDTFIQESTYSEDDLVEDYLKYNFESLIIKLGITDPYTRIEYSDLDEDQKNTIDKLNIYEMLNHSLSQIDIDLPTASFVLSRLTDLKDDSQLERVVNSLDKLHPLMPNVIAYFKSLENVIDENARSYFAGKLLSYIEEDNSALSTLEFHRLWILSLFSTGSSWDNQDRLFKLLGRVTDYSCRRELLLAIGRAGQRHWFQSQWRDVFNEAPWPRRAALAAASCLPPDARKHWYKSINSRLDRLELAVANWAKANPF